LKFYKIFLLITLLSLTGCVVQNEKKIVQKKPKKNKTLLQIKTKEICEKHKKTMKYAFTYIVNEFDKGYFFNKDILGAKAQLFLIKNQSQSPFAQNINSANTSYKKHYQLAKKYNCNLRNHINFPLSQIENKIKKLESRIIKSTSK